MLQPHISITVHCMLCALRRLCLLRYEKELLKPDSWLSLLAKIEAPLTDEQTAAFAGEECGVRQRRRAGTQFEEASGLCVPSASTKLLMYPPTCQPHTSPTRLSCKSPPNCLPCSALQLAGWCVSGGG